MKNAILILSFLLALSLVFNWLQYQNANLISDFRAAEQLQFADALEKSRQRVQSYADSASHERNKRVQTDSIANIALKRLQMRNRAMSENAQKLREPVQALIDSVQALADFVANQDSTLAVRQEIIGTLEKRLESDSISYNKELAHKDNQNLETIEALRNAVLMADNLQTDLNKSEKKAKKRWGLSGIAGYGVSKDGLTPFIGGGVSYDFIKF